MDDKVTAVKAQFKAEGVTVTEWARAKGFSLRLVRAVMSGQCKGDRGESHRIAVALGLKDEPANIRFRSNAA